MQRAATPNPIPTIQKITNQFQNHLRDGPLSGSTWDAKHLDNFLKNCKFIEKTNNSAEESAGKKRDFVNVFHKNRMADREEWMF